MNMDDDKLPVPQPVMGGGVNVDQPPPPLAGQEVLGMSDQLAHGVGDTDEGDDEMKKAFSRRFFPR